MLGVPTLLGEPERGDAIQLGHRSLRRSELNVSFEIRFAPSFRPRATGLPDDQHEHREDHDRERALDDERRHDRGGPGQAQLRLQRLDVVGAFAGLDDACHHDRDLGRRCYADGPVGSLIGDIDLREHQVPHPEGRDPVTERVSGPAVLDPRELRLLRLEDLELADDPTDPGVGDLVSGIRFDDEGQAYRIPDGDTPLVDRRCDAYRGFGGGELTHRQQQQRGERRDPHQLRLDRALNRASRAGT